jgi:cytochrome c oxidase subunit 2
VAASTQHDFSRAFEAYAWVLGGWFAFTIVLIAIVLIRYRAGRPGKPSAPAAGHLLEAAAVLALAITATYLIAETFTVANQEDSLAATSAVRVDVIAYQWGWEFDYPGTQIRVVGESGAAPTLVLPAGRVVQVSLRSRDVIHSFWVPRLRFKRDAIPGLVGRFDVTVPLGDHPGACSLFCGLQHAEMLFTLRGVDAAGWRAFLARGGSQ